MKHFTLCLLLLTLASCSQQDDPVVSTANTDLSAEEMKTIESPASNSANPYDLAGQVHDELFAAYFAQQPFYSDVAGIANRVETLAAQSANFASLTGASSSRTTAARTQAWIGHETCGETDAIARSNLGQAAKTSLTQFTNTLLAMNTTVTEYDSFYSFIESYEANVLVDPAFTSNEKERLLTVASICRYVTYREKKKPKKNTDPEWDHIVFSIAGGIDGGERNAAESVVNALTAGIVQNQKP